MLRRTLILAAEGGHNPVVPQLAEVILGLVAFLLLFFVIKKFVSPRRPNRSILMVPRSFLNSSGSHFNDARCPTAMITLSTAKRSAGASRSIVIGDALIAPLN